jgi:hypothetical protein
VSTKGEAKIDENVPLDRVTITEISAQNDPRQLSDAFVSEKLRGLEGLKKNRTWQEFCSHHVPKDANKMNGRFVLTIN